MLLYINFVELTKDFTDGFADVTSSSFETISSQADTSQSEQSNQEQDTPGETAGPQPQMSLYISRRIRKLD